MILNDYKSISILEVASRLGIAIKKDKALCFAHDEKTPSLYFNEKKGVYYCHGCGVKGNTFSLVRAVLKLDNRATHQWLQNNYLGGPNPLLIKIKPIKRATKSPIVDDENNIPNPGIYEWIINETSLSKKGSEYLIDLRGFKVNRNFQQCTLVAESRECVPGDTLVRDYMTVASAGGQGRRHNT